MAITEIVSDITGVGPTASFVLGSNTMIPYAGVQIIGLTDGTSPATASKNMAEIYNLNRFERKLAIEMAGLTYDPTDDSQFVRAMQLLPNLSPKRFGTFPSVLAPVSAPSLADPATVKTNTNGEVFMWNGNGWVYVGGGALDLPKQTVTSYGNFPTVLNGTFSHTTTPITITNPSGSRVLRLTFDSISGFFYNNNLPLTSSYLYANVKAGSSLVSRGLCALTYRSGNEHHIYNSGFLQKNGGYIDILPSENTQITIEVTHAINPNGGSNVLLDSTTENYVNCSFVGTFLG